MSRSAAPATTAPVLRIVHDLTSALDAARICYCHWKGNARLHEAARGLRDLDVLVDRDHALALSGVLATVGFKRFVSSPWTAVPAVEDYVALDADTGRLVHLHLHYRDRLLLLREGHVLADETPASLRERTGRDSLDDAFLALVESR